MKTKDSHIKHIRRQLPRWISYVKGTSKLHVPLSPMKNPSNPREVRDYICDFTPKLESPYDLDLQGVPTNRLYDGRLVYFPIAISQKLIAKLQRGDLLEECFPLAHWICENIEHNGAIKTWTHLGNKVTSPYSAMTQGQCLSALIRFELRFPGCSGVQSAISQLCDGLTNGQSLGIVQLSESRLPILVETPLPSLNVILNGWCFALWGALEAGVFTNRQDVTTLASDSLTCLASSLPQYSSYWWSYYDDKGRVASPFYHDLHITLLQALYHFSSNDTFLHVRRKFERQRKNPICKGIAITHKATQKILEQPYPEFSS